MERLAVPGSILVTEHTYRLTEGYFEFKSLEAAQVQGVSEPVPIYEVVGVGPLRTHWQRSARRGLVKFVGRQSEMEAMKRAWELARAGHGQIVAVVGEAGLGKSRLTYEFKAIGHSGCLLLETFSVSHGKASAYLPLIDLLKNYFQIEAVDDEQRRREKVTDKVCALDRSLDDILPYLFPLLSISDPHASLQQMDPQIRRQRTFEAIKRLLLRESLNQPLLIIFEDLHWLDSETEAFLDVLSESITSTRVLLLVNYRPEYEHGWGNKTYYTQLRLDPLREEDAEELLQALLGDDEELQPLKRLILEKTEGNPFFTEEIVQGLWDEGVLARNGVVSLTRPLTEIHIPPTVQGVLMARIDRLPAEEKSLLQTLSVIGKEFSFNLIQRVVGQPEEQLYPLLSRLRGGEFIYEQPAFPDIEYTFKHALTQEVAYHSVLRERRSVLHERTGQAMEEVFGNRLEDHYSELAHHYSRSGNTQKAVDYLQRAGQQTAQRSVYEEAIRHLTTALDLLTTLPDTPERTQQELTLRLALGPALMALKGWAAPDVEQVYLRARELCLLVEETPQLFTALGGLCSFHVVRGDYRTARELGEQCLRLAQSAQDPALLLEAHRMLGQTLALLGEVDAARRHLEQVIVLYDPQQHFSHAFRYTGLDSGVWGRCYAALALWHLGYPEQALQQSREALALAQELSHPFTLASALRFAAFLQGLLREVQVVREQAEAVMALSIEQGFSFWLACATIWRGRALAEQGQGEEGIAQMRQGIADVLATGGKVGMTYALALLAEAYGKVGQTEEGLKVVAEALALVDQMGERLWEAELYRLKGELLLRQKEKGERKKEEMEAEAETCFRQAMNIARCQSAKSWELRAAMSLARLWQQQGKKEEARQLLSEIYGWFTEGFGTADLKEAKTLLEELS